MSRRHLFSSFIVRALAREKLRAALSVTGIALGVAVMVAIRLANSSVLDSFQAAVDAVSGDADLRIVGPTGAFDETRLKDAFWLEQYGQVSPVLENYAMVVTGEGTPITTDGPLTRGELLFVLGVDVLRDTGLRKYDVLQLGENADRLEPREILDLLLRRDAVILTERFAERGGWRIGDTIPLAFGSEVRSLTVRGLLRDAGPARTMQGNFAIMDLAAAQWASGRIGLLDAVDLRLTAGLDLEQVRAEIQARLPEGMRVEPPSSRTGRTAIMVAAFQFNLAALSSIALLVGLFLIYNTVSVSVSARRDEIGVLTAVGANRGTIVGLFLAEALLLAAVGVVTGLPLGQWLARFAVGATAQTVETFYIAAVAETTSRSVVLAPFDALFTSLLAVGLAMLAALAPALGASRVDPIAVVRGSDGIRRRRGFRRASVAAVPLVLLALATARMPPLFGLPIFGFVTELLLLAAIVCVTPALLAGMSQMLGAVATRAGWITGRLAAANMLSAVPATSISVAALAASLGMMMAIGVMVGSFRETVVYWLDSVLTSDLVVKPVMNSSSLSTATLSSEVADAIRDRPEVRAVTWYSSRQIPFRDSMIRLDTSDLASLLEHGRILFKSPHDAARQVRLACRSDAPFALVSESFSLKYHRIPGDSVTLDTPQGPRAVRIIAVYYDYSSNLGTVLLDNALYTSWFGDDDPRRSPMALSVYLRKGYDPEVVRRDWAERFGRDRALYFVTNEGVRREAMRIFESTFTITYALQLIAILIAGAGVVATLLRLIRERQGEIGLLSLIGMSTKQVRRMVVQEAVMIGAMSQILGIGIGIALSLVLIRVINVQSFGWTIQFHMPLQFIVQSTGAVLIAALVFGWIPARRAVGIDALATVREL